MIIYKEEWCGPYSQLCEAAFLDQLFRELKALMGGQFDKYKFFVYSSNGDDNPPKPIVLTGNDPKVLIYISDERSTVPTYLEDYFVAVFKAYLPGNFDRHKLYPFPLGYHQDVPLLPMCSINDRMNSVFFSGNLHRKRMDLYKELSFLRIMPNGFYERLMFRVKNRVPKDLSHSFKNSYIQFTDGFGQGMTGKEYACQLHNSKIAICPPGFFSHETFRHFEAMRAGCIVVTKELPDTYFYKNSPLVVIRDWRELRPTIHKLLNDPGRLNDIHLKTLAWWKNICSEKAVANYMVGKIGL